MSAVVSSRPEHVSIDALIASELAPLLSKDPTLIAATLMWNHSRGRDDATVLVFNQGDSGE